MRLDQLLGRKWDAIFVGTGHNALVCASYLAERGYRVLMLEQRGVIGGACVSEPFPDFPDALQTSTSYVLSLFPRKIIKDLHLFEHGLELIERNPNAFTPMKDGRYLLRYDEMERTQAEIAKFSKADAEAYPEFAASLHDIAVLSNKLMFQTPPDPFRKRDWFKMLSLGRKILGLGKKEFYKMVELFTVSAHSYVTNYVKSEPLVATLCSDGIIGTCGGPKTAGTAYVFLHHDIGDLSDEFGKWFYTKGGMGGVTQAIASYARAHGVEILTGADVKRVLTKKGRVEGVEVSIGGNDVRFSAKRVVSGADAYQTYVHLCDADDLPDGFLGHVEGIDYSSPTFKVNLLIKDTEAEHLQWLCDYDGPIPPGTIHIGCESSDDIERAYDDSKYGQLSKELVLEMCVLPKETAMAPDGYRSVSILGQYVPFRHPSGEWSDAAKADLMERTLSKLDEYCNIRELVVASDMLTPECLERKYRLTGGNIFQGAMPLKQLLMFRPVPGWAKYRGPIKGLWMCGSACHPGGGVTGIPGHNAAREILKG